MSQEQFFED